MLSWFRRSTDPFEERARDLPIVLDRRLDDSFPEIQSLVPALGHCPRDTWRQHATIAAASLTVFPLLRTVRGDIPRYYRLVDLLRTSLREQCPDADRLWAEAEQSTVPPTGQEQTRTLHEIDESQSLALARWILLGLPDSAQIGSSWEPVQALARVLRQLAQGYWNS